MESGSKRISLDRAEVCELVGLYLLNILKSEFEIEREYQIVQR